MASQPDERHPPEQYLRAEYVVGEMAKAGAERVDSLSTVRILVLAAMGGGFVTVGALLSVLVAAAVSTPGPARLLEGLGFSAGFYFVILSGAVLFTEANVVLPATLLERPTGTAIARIARFWALAWIGNLAGAVLLGLAVHFSQHYPADVSRLLHELVARKMQYRRIGGADGWFQVVVSGVLANWLVGMAAFFAVMARTIFGKYIPIFLAVTAFVAANLQHSPANMGYFALIMPGGHGPGWGPALVWNVIPAGIGNMLGGAFLVAVPFRFAFARFGDRGAGPAPQSDRDA
jgi:formate/nitrite transporter FocA (FNT family)